MDDHDPGEVVRAAERIVEAYGAHDTERYFASFHPDATFLFYTSPRRLGSVAEFRAEWERWEREDGFRVLDCRSSDQHIQLLGDVASLHARRRQHDTHGRRGGALDRTRDHRLREAEGRTLAGRARASLARARGGRGLAAPPRPGRSTISRKGWALFIALCIIWGIPYLFIRVAVREVSPAALVFFRTAPAALLLAPIALHRGELRQVLGHWRWVLAYTAVELAIPWLLLFHAEQRLTSSMAGLLIAAVPLDRRGALPPRRVHRPRRRPPDGGPGGRLRRRGGPRRHRHRRQRPPRHDRGARRSGLLCHRPADHQPPSRRAAEPCGHRGVARDHGRAVRSPGAAQPA